jgi:hypothetical protein
MAARRRKFASALNEPWYTQDRDERAMSVQSLVSSYKTHQAGRRASYIRNLEAFEKRAMLGYGAHAYCEGNALGYGGERLGLTRSAVQTAVANVYAPQKPKPQFQTLGADWGTRRKAQRLDKVCEGILNQRQGRWINCWSMMIDAGVEAALQGVACLMVTADKAKMRIDHRLVPLPDLFTDPVQGRDPSDLVCRLPIGVDEAIGKHDLRGEAADAVARAPAYDWYGVSSAVRASAMRTVELQLAWHLPNGPDQPGVWNAGVGGVTVDGGDWTAPAFPFVFLHWEPWRDGFWGSGLGDEGREMAEKLDDLDLRLHAREIIASGTKIFYTEGTVKPDDLMVNESLVGVSVERNAPFPQQQNIVAFNPMELDYLKFKTGNYWDAIGISQVSAAARREQGVSSGVAIRTLNDTKAGRQLVKAQRYEQAFVDLAHQHVWRLRELAEEDPKFIVKWPGKAILRQIKWSDCNIEDDSFAITVAPASALPHDPAGRQQMIQDLYAGGLISQETAKQLMGWPDLDSELEVENAETEYVDMLIERYLDADQKTWGMGDYDAPEGFIINKVGTMRRFASAYFRARIDQATLATKKEKAKAEFCIKHLVRYIKDLDALMNKPPPEYANAAKGIMPAPPIAGGAPMPPGAPGAGPPMVGPPMAPQMLPQNPVGPPAAGPPPVGM